MTGTRWLHRAKQRYGTGPELYHRMKERITSKVRSLHPLECQTLLESFGGPNGPGSKNLQIKWIGCWSQSLDEHLRQTLGRKLRDARKTGKA